MGVYSEMAADLRDDVQEHTTTVQDAAELAARRADERQQAEEEQARATLDDAAKKAVDPAKLAKLEELEKTIEGFQAIDDVKDKLDKLPNAGGLTIDDQEAVKAAQEAYDKLTDDQKEYLSGSQIDRMEKVTNRMEEIIKENPTPTPTPGGNGGSKKPSQSTGKDVKSGNTGDAGITLYLGMGLVAVLAGAVIVIRKRKEN